MTYLLDTNVVSELRKVGGGKADPNVTNWFSAVDLIQCHISAISIMELEVGILLVERRDAEQGALLRQWMTRHVLPVFDGRVLAVDTAVAIRCAALHVPHPQSGSDALIAATALAHGLTVVTRNTRDFISTGVELIDPWSASPPM